MSDLALFEIDQSQIINDAKGDCFGCAETESYVMEGVCHNCHEVVYGRFRKGHRTRALTCNHCGGSGMFDMTWKRLVR